MKTILFAALASLVLTSAQAQITSTFDTDADGWILRNDGDNVTATAIHTSTGGNPGGFISGTLAYDNYPGFFWYAPTKFLGNLMYRSFGQTLSFSQQQAVVGDINEYNGNYYEGFHADIMITSGNNTIYYHLPKPAIAPAWSTYTITLDTSSPWRTSASASSPLATINQIKAALINVTEFAIRGNYNNTANTVSLDQVSIGQRSLTTPLTISTISQLSGKPGSSITISGSNFGASIDDNSVYFGGVAATITNASATSLTVTVPVGASYDKITIINKTTGVSIKSAQPFNPTFDDGGRIITASFKPKVDFLLGSTAGNDVNGIRAADLDGDGWNDLIVTEQTPASVSIFQNLGTGGDVSTAAFSSKIVLTGGGASGGLFIADLDGDGKHDIVAANNSTFATFRNTSTHGNITFETVETWSMANSGFLSNVADIDGDGRLELIGQHGNGSVAVDFWIAQNISSSGNIEFGPSVSYFGGGDLDAGDNVSVGDLDSDGKPELLVSHGFGDRISILQNNSLPGTIALTNLGTIVTGQYNLGLSISDFNLDGKNDIVWKRSSSIYIRLNTNSGAVLAPTDFNTEIVLTGDLSTYGGMSIGDINGDGKPDIVATDNADVGVFENAYAGGVFDAKAFIPAYQHQGNGNSTYPTSPVTADLNGDSKPELILGITNTSPVRISIFENNNMHPPVISVNTVSPLKGVVGSTVTITGNNFSPTPSENKVFFGGVEATVLTASENLITAKIPAGAGYERVSVVRNGLTSFYHLPFNTTFGLGVSFDNTSFLPPINYPLTGADYDVEVADMNSDGKPEIVAESRIVTGIIRNYGLSYRNVHTTGAITATSFILDDTTATSARNLKLMDVDSDGRPDILAPEGIYRNTSTASEISYDVNVGLAANAFNHSWADFNQDGKIDIASTGGAVVSLFENRSARPEAFTTGTFSTVSTAVNISKPAADGGLTVADFDNDGLSEFVSTNPSTDNMSVWRNTGSYRIAASQFTVVGNLATGDNPGRVYTGDLDVDGKMDLLLYHNTGANTVLLTVFHNQSTPGNIVFTRVDFTLPAAATVAHIRDLDGDGRPEILATSEGTDQFFILKNTSSPGVIDASSFATPFAMAVTNPRGITTGDLNADDKPEIIITSAPNALLVFENAISSGPPITISTQPAFTYACEGGSASFTTAASGTTNITYQWQKFNGSVFVNLVNSTTYSGVTNPTLTVSNVSASEAGDYQCVISGDFAADVITAIGNLVFNSLPTPPDVVNGVRCGSGAVTLAASGGSPGDYRWYSGSPLTLIAGEQDDTFVTPSLLATTTYHVSVRGTFCESIPVAVTATISSPPAQPVITSSIAAIGNALTICSSASLTLSAPNGFSSYSWSTGAVTSQISVSASGSYSVTVTNGAGCTSPASDVIVITVVPIPCNNSAPVINSATSSTTIGGQTIFNLLDFISDADNNLVLSSLTVLQQPGSGAIATISNSMLTINYSGISFTGKDQLTIQVCDEFGECVQQILEIDVIGDIEIYNALSPNDDQLNPIFLIRYIDLLPDTQNNMVSIFNRWGSKVFEVDNYNNTDRVFKGLNQSGNELPSGTYFYKIVFISPNLTDSEKEKTGYLVLKR